MSPSGTWAHLPSSTCKGRDPAGWEAGDLPKAVGGGPLCTRPSAGLGPHRIVSLQGVGRKDSRDAGLGRVRRTEPPLLALPPRACVSLTRPTRHFALSRAGHRRDQQSLPGFPLKSSQLSSTGRLGASFLWAGRSDRSLARRSGVRGTQWPVSLWSPAGHWPPVLFLSHAESEDQNWNEV